MLASRFTRSGVALAALLFSCGARASAQDPRFEVSINTGNASPPFVFQGPEPFRAPVPSFESTDRQDLWLTGFDVRAYWMKRLSLIVQASFGNEPSGHFAFIQSAIPAGFGLPSFSVDETVKHQVWTASLLQSVDLVARGRIRPWVGGGITYVRALDHQQLTSVSQSNPSTVSVDTTDIDRSAGAVVAAVGVRIYLTHRLFISGDESFRGYLGGTPLGTFNALWRAGLGVGF